MESKPSSPELPIASGFGARLHAARTQTGVPMEALAAAAGVGKTYISKLELGRVAHPSAQVALAIARELKVDLAWLLLGEPPRPQLDPDSLRSPGAVAAALRHLADAISEAENSSPGGLPVINSGVNCFPVVRDLQELRLRLKAATRGHGHKAALAKHLGVSPAQLSPWLSGKREPGGEMTLRLLAWVQAAETKKKSPAGAQTPAGQQTRSRRSSNEQPESNPP